MSAGVFPGTPYNPPAYAELPDVFAGALVAGHGRDYGHASSSSPIAAVVTGAASTGSGPDYAPHPGLPPIGLLEYVQKFAVAILVLLGVLLFLGHGVANPAGAVRLLVRGAKRQTGVA